MDRLQVQLRFFHSRKVLLILFWAAFPLAFYSNPNLPYAPYILLSMVWFPIAGCLSDICVSRYVVIRYSLWFMWLFVMFFNILLIFQQYLWSSQTLEYLELVVWIMTFFGMAGVWTNIFQFGVDQLTDASSSDITSYISWYVWIIFFAPALVPFLQKCSCGDYNKVTTYFPLPFIGTVALVTDFLFNKYLVKEPPTRNTFKLVYQVLKFAAKNKHPRLRSAFTYWEDKPYSRIDLGKAKYGGPFTTEQVEDVKTFFRLLAIIAVSGPYFGIVYILYSSFRDLEFFTIDSINLCSDASVHEYLAYCFLCEGIKYSTFIIMVFMIPLFELFVYPLIMKFHCTLRLKIKHKLTFGTLLLLAYEVCAVGFEIANRYLDTSHLNSTFYSYYEGQVYRSTVLDYKWLTLLQPILGTAMYILLASYLELLCAQSPYSMKGLLLGMFYSASILCTAVSTGLAQVLTSTLENLGRAHLLWLYIAVLILTMLHMCVQFISLKCYTLRKRDETLRNDQMFAVDYFNKYLSSRPPQNNLHQ